MDKETTGMIESAMALALNAHRGQVRKGGHIPYIMHPIEVGLILSQAGCRDETICAGFLHDILEDTSMDIGLVKAELGERVKELIEFMTEPEHDARPWKQRKQHTIDLVSQTEDQEKLLLLLADKLANVRSIERDRQRLGCRIWDRFNEGKEQQEWYYTSLATALYPRLAQHTLYEEYETITNSLFD